MRSSRSESKTNTSSSSSNTYFFIAPLQQRLIEFEGRLRKWRIFNRRSSSASRTRTAGVETVSVDLKQDKSRPICFTSPIPRKTYYDNNNMNEPRRRPVIPVMNAWGTQRQFVPDEEVNRKYKIIEENSGNLAIDGTIYNKVKTCEIDILSTLGNGTCGTVHRVKYQNRLMAEKEMKRTDNREETKRILMDLYVIRQSNRCDFIVKCYGYIITEDYVKIYMELMSSCAEKLLFTRNNVGFPEEIIGKIALSVTKALIFLKDELSLMHRDIKPSNILLDIHGNIKLCDFGISGQLIDSNAASLSAGCISYLAPERTKSEPYNAQADVWSFGITLIHLAWGVVPYLRIFGRHLDPFHLMLEIGRSPPPKLDQNDGYSIEFCDFVDKCLQPTANQRPKFKGLLELPFLVRAAHSSIDVGHWMSNQNEYNPPPGRSN